MAQHRAAQRQGGTVPVCGDTDAGCRSTGRRQEARDRVAGRRRHGGRWQAAGGTVTRWQVAGGTVAGCQVAGGTGTQWQVAGGTVAGGRRHGGRVAGRRRHGDTVTQ